MVALPIGFENVKAETPIVFIQPVAEHPEASMEYGVPYFLIVN